MHASVTEDSILRANTLFWEQMLAMSLNLLSTSSASPQCIGAEHVVGSCDLSGEWNGRIEVRLSRGLALKATATLKSALPRPCVMSVPSADLEPNDFYSRPQTEDSLTVFFHHATGQLMIRVCEIAVEPELALSGI